MASNIQTLKGTDIISKTYDIINENFKTIEEMISAMESSANGEEYSIKKMTWDRGNNLFRITLKNGKVIESGEILPATTLRSGLLSNGTQNIGGDKKFNNNITLNDTGSGLYGTKNKLIISQDNGHVYIGGENGIVITYDNDGNVTGISMNLSSTDKKYILNEINDELSEAVEKLKEQTDKTITVWQIDGFDDDADTDIECINGTCGHTELNHNKVKPWLDDENINNDVESDHEGDVLYSKTSKTYFEYTKQDDGTYIWEISDDNIFGSINDQIGDVKTKIDGMADGVRNFIIATRTEMNNGTDGTTNTQHRAGDVWVVKEGDSDDTAGLYEDFVLGGFYLCDAGNNSDHYGNDSVIHVNGENWILLTDYDSLIEQKLDADSDYQDSLKNSKDAAEFINAATADGVISVIEKISLRTEWKKISGYETISEVTGEASKDDNKYTYTYGSFGEALQDANKFNGIASSNSLVKYSTKLITAFQELKTYLNDKIQLDKNEHVDLVSNWRSSGETILSTKINEAKNEFLEKFNNYYKAEQDLYSAISYQPYNDLYNTGGLIENLQKQLESQKDGSLTIWYRNYKPDDSTQTAEYNSTLEIIIPWYDGKNWTTEDGKGAIDADTLKNHEEDYYAYVSSDNKDKKCYVFNSSHTWEEITESSKYPTLVSSIFKSASAQAAADGKVNCFNRKPIPNKQAYQVGDMWLVCQEDVDDGLYFGSNENNKVKNGEIIYCTNSRNSGDTYFPEDWSRITASLDTDTMTTLETAIASSEYINSQMDSVLTTWFKTYNTGGYKRDTSGNVTNVIEDISTSTIAYNFNTSGSGANAIYIVPWYNSTYGWKANGENSGKGAIESDTLKAHLGDYYIYKDENYNSNETYVKSNRSKYKGCYQFVKTDDANNNLGYKWEEIASSGEWPTAAQTLFEAADATIAADGKINTFIYSTEHPTPFTPYGEGDMFIKDGILESYCTTGRLSGYYDSKDWKSLTTNLNTEQANELSDALRRLGVLEQKDGAVDIWYRKYLPYDETASSTGISDVVSKNGTIDGTQPNSSKQTEYCTIGGYRSTYHLYSPCVIPWYSEEWSNADGKDLNSTVLENHVGDIYVYTCTINKKVYKACFEFQKYDDTNYYYWGIISEDKYPTVASALFESASATAAADGVIHTYIGDEPSGVTLSNGDIWIDSNNIIHYYDDSKDPKWQTATAKASTQFDSAFTVEDKVTQYGETKVNGGLTLGNMLFVKDNSETAKVTGGLSGMAKDEVGLFLGCTYEEAYGYANWDSFSTTQQSEYYPNGKPDVPVVLTKRGYGSKIGGCYFDESTQKLQVPVENITGDIICNSLKADKDSENSNDAEATVTSDTFKIKYGNAYIEISLINGVPTIIGVDTNGDTVWSLGEGSNDSAMYNLVYNAINGDILYVENGDSISSAGASFNASESLVKTQLPTFTIVNKYPSTDTDDEPKYMIVPTKTRMRYKIGNKVKYFTYDVIQKCPYYAEPIDIMCGFPIAITKDKYNNDVISLGNSIMYDLVTNVKYESGYTANTVNADTDKGYSDDDELIKIKNIINKSGKNILRKNLVNDIIGSGNGYKETFEISNKTYYAIKPSKTHTMKYASYYLNYLKQYHLKEYNAAIYKVLYYAGMYLEDNNHINSGTKKSMSFYNDFDTITDSNNFVTGDDFDYTHFFTNYTTNSDEKTYEVNIVNQDGDGRNIIASLDKPEYKNYTDTLLSFVIKKPSLYDSAYSEKSGNSTTGAKYDESDYEMDWDKYSTTHSTQEGYGPNESSYASYQEWYNLKKQYYEERHSKFSDGWEYMIIPSRKDELPTPENMDELSWACWRYSLQSIKNSINSVISYNNTDDDYYPRIFDVSSEIELFDTANAEDYEAMSYVIKKNTYSKEVLYDVSNYNNDVDEITKYYKDFKLDYVYFGNSNIIDYNETSSTAEYKYSITESLNNDKYSMVCKGDSKSFFLNGNKIEENLDRHVGDLYVYYDSSTSEIKGCYRFNDSHQWENLNWNGEIISYDTIRSYTGDDAENNKIKAYAKNHIYNVNALYTKLGITIKERTKHVTSFGFPQTPYHKGDAWIPCEYDNEIYHNQSIYIDGKEIVTNGSKNYDLVYCKSDRITGDIPSDYTSFSTGMLTDWAISTDVFYSYEVDTQLDGKITIWYRSYSPTDSTKAEYNSSLGLVTPWSEYVSTSEELPIELDYFFNGFRDFIPENDDYIGCGENIKGCYINLSINSISSGNNKDSITLKDNNNYILDFGETTNTTDGNPETDDGVEDKISIKVTTKLGFDNFNYIIPEIDSSISFDTIYDNISKDFSVRRIFDEEYVDGYEDPRNGDPSIPVNKTTT